MDARAPSPAVGYCGTCGIGFCPEHLIEHDPRCKGRPDPGILREGQPCHLCAGVIVPTPGPIEERLNCRGYWGFGAGYLAAMGKAPPPGEPIHCSSACRWAVLCWEEHKARIRRLFPELAEAMDRFAARYGTQREAVAHFFQAQIAEGVAEPVEPYTKGAGANYDDGAGVALLGAPKDRGPAFTVPWPFPPHRGPDA